jgi:putative NADPH-quinone reductase
MKVMLVVDHPYGVDAWDNTPHRRSFTAALAHAAQLGLEEAGHDIDLIDLHGDGFNPVMSAEELSTWRAAAPSPDPLTADYQRRLLEADYLVLAFPIWWEAMPAPTKGFIDKVVAKGIAYHPNQGIPPMTNQTKLRGVSVITVMSTPGLAYRLIFGNPITKILFRGTFSKIGVKHLTWLNHPGSDRQTDQTRRQALTDIQRKFAALN